MAERSVYIETTILSYLAARPSHDPRVAVRQQTTHDWWDTRRGLFDLYVSQLVRDEASDGDPGAAQRRLQFLAGIRQLDVSEEATELAASIIEERILPEAAARDALHIGITAVHGLDILLTWNCKHLANGETMGAVAHFLLSRGYEPPVMCTPDELMGE